MLINDKNNPTNAVSITYDRNILCNLGQWRFLSKRDYVMALEPCNNLIKGAEFERQNGTLNWIAPDETVSIILKIKFFDLKQSILEEKGRILKLK